MNNNILILLCVCLTVLIIEVAVISFVVTGVYTLTKALIG